MHRVFLITMHRVFRDLERVSLNHMQDHLWLTLSFKAGKREDVNIMGTGNFTIFTKEKSKLKPTDNVTLAVDEPSRVVFFEQDIPALTTIKVFDKDNELLFHLITEEKVEIN